MWTKFFVWYYTERRNTKFFERKVLIVNVLAGLEGGGGVAEPIPTTEKDWAFLTYVMLFQRMGMLNYVASLSGW
jgi:hypothetical protein